MNFKKNVFVAALVSAITACGGGSGGSDDPVTDTNSMNTGAGDGTGIGADTGTDADTGTGADAGTGTDTDTDTSTGTDTDTGTGADTSADAGTGTDASPVGSTDGSELRFIGNVTLAEFFNQTAGFATFDRTPESFTLEQLEAELFAEGCTVDDEDSDDDDDSVVSVSAGDALVVTGTGGTYATLARDTFGSGDDVTELYQSPVLQGSLPSGLVLDIPGDEFPSFSNIPFPTGDSVQISSPTAGATFSPGDSITWVPDSGSTPSFVSVVMTLEDSFGNESEIDCEVADNGTFTFPESTLQSNENSQVTELSVLRINYQSHTNGNAVLVIATTSGDLVIF